MKNPYASALLAWGILWASGCAEHSDAEALESEAPSDGALWSTYTLFPTGDVEVCISPIRPGMDAAGNPTTETVPADDPDFIAYLNIVRPLVEEQYERIDGAHIDLRGWGVCADRTTGSFLGGIRLTADISGNGSGATRRCKPSTENPIHGNADDPSCKVGFKGYSPDFETSVFVQSNRNMGVFQRTVLLHEFGHALGFHHEFDRADSTQNPGDCIPRTPSASSQGLTIYDADSILNGSYCFSRASLSRLDRLGLAIAYPASLRETASIGPQFFAGDDRMITIAGTRASHRWLDEGAGPAAFSARPTWYADGTALGQDSVELPAGSYTLRGSFTDFRNRVHTIEDVPLEANTGRYVSIATTVL